MHKKSQSIAQLGLLIALQIILTVTPLGFIVTPVVTITIMHIPVLIGAMTMGIKGGGILGLTFGIASLITATVRGTPDAIVFSPFLSGSWLSLIVCIVPRVLFGIFAALIFQGLRKTSLSLRVSAGITAGVGTLLHTIMVLGSVYLLLGELYAKFTGLAYNTLLVVFLGVLGTNGIIEALAAIVVCVALIVPLSKIQKQTS